MFPSSTTQTGEGVAAFPALGQLRGPGLHVDPFSGPWGNRRVIHHQSNARVRSNVLGMTSVFCRDPIEVVSLIKGGPDGGILGISLWTACRKRDIFDLRQNGFGSLFVFVHWIMFPLMWGEAKVPLLDRC